MKKILLTVLAVIMAGALTACGQSGQVEETKETVQEEGTEQITEEAAIVRWKALRPLWKR